MNLIRKYFDLNTKERCQRIDDDVCNDLNIDTLFDIIDYTCSSVGQQYLYHCIRSVPSENRVNEEWISQLSSNDLLKNRIFKHLKKLDNADAYHIYPLIKQDYTPFSNRKLLMLRLLQFIPLILTLMFIYTFSYWILLGLFAAFIANMAMHFRSKMLSFLYSGSIPELYKLLNTAQYLNEMKDVGLNIEEDLKAVSELKRKLSFFRLNARMDSDIAVIIGFVTEMVRIFLLIEPINLNNIFTYIKRTRTHLENIFEYVGFVDAMQSIEKLRSENPYYCQPLFSDRNILEVEDMFHPLIVDCVANSFLMREGKSFLIMGSNMSGKTSFVRTVGINVLMAQTINTSFAKKMELSRQKLYTAIAINDNLMEGHSYYPSEVLRIKDIIENAEQGCNLILLDELLKGTNTIERIAGAKAILNYLSRNKENKILVATHDIELLEMLKDGFEPIYFREDIQNNQLTFDYKINHNHVGQRNAIRILKLYGFPDSIIDDALYVADKI